MEGMPKISESEWEIMKTVWKENPLTAEQIVQQLPKDTEWSDQTVRTFINRLMKKKALGYQKSGRSYQYYPLISEKECVRAESKSFLNRVFNGAAGLMMTNFLEETQLSDKEIERLQQILTEKQGRDPKDPSRP
ncbi:BlaI/MecI/CopY family transcriptional regulator [Paenibacillus dokdonensis]|uniref:BlaI/MecI/CopY family transcriptional regulator n=1 Tax=Paenibacillus dokdonensis TaxID=2567944 RepID=A0ABU6GR27_9BACL|nr:BlaI/MecI/CopY family transcriptional regulator [Paenibacillus dokdonensis]MEC0242184.1 BlaI/MecI/CopY family transcriptional regulator [Paenibacillus dokdonensis]